MNENNANNPDQLTINVDDINKTTHTVGTFDENIDNAAISQKNSTNKTFSQKWTDVINSFRKPIVKVLLTIVDYAATNPKTCITAIISLSVALVVIGLFTNFSVDVDEDVLWTPMGSRPLSHGEWIDDESGFVLEPRNFLVLVHSEGQSVLGVEGARRLFLALDTIRETPGYDEVCAQTPRSESCQITSATDFWNHTSVMEFDKLGLSDQEVIETMSASEFPDGTPVDEMTVFGKPVFGDDSVLVSATAFFMIVNLPEVDDAESFETDSIDRMLEMKDAWAAENGNIFRLEIFTARSFSDEFTRAIVSDIPLVPAVFVIMSIFTCIVFFRRSWVNSRTLLGFGAVVCVMLSIMTGYGFMFIIGIPFTSMTQILPFIMFGIGLDAAFIISGQYARTDPTKSPEERIHETIEDVGLSILLTTMTSVVAFGLGCLSTIPAVYWLCLYAFPTIFIDFVYQITFFIALVVIDERRVKDKRRDCLVCISAPSAADEENNDAANVGGQPYENFFDKAMGWFADQLFRPWVKVLVLLSFAGLLAGCAYSASLLTQEFDFTDVVPTGSYVTDFWDSFDLYTEQSGTRPGVYFRFVDQSDPIVQQQMDDYVHDLVTSLDEISEEPVFFWLRDFREFMNDTSSTDLMEQPFKDQLAAFLEDPVYKELHEDDIVLDAEGNIVASRTVVSMDRVDQEEVVRQVDALKAQREVSERQPVNKDRNDWAFFTFDGQYYIWEFYSAAPEELTLTTILGVSAVTAIALLFIPHWTAALFIGPLIGILYVDLLGVLQFAGLHINAVSYISLVMSIGLLVDFLMHVLLRYYESSMDGREAKVRDTLRTMGSSILIGGISTFLGVIPLAFSSSEIFSTIFVTFIGLVTLGASHGLILLPVLLSILGPNVSILDKKKETAVVVSSRNEGKEASLEDVA